jgi:collagen type VII alpha
MQKTEFGPFILADSNSGGPGTPPGPPGVQGPTGPTGPKGDTGTVIVGNFGATKVPIDLPTNGFIPVNWDSPGNPPAAFQMLVGQGLLYSVNGHVWVYVSTTVNPAGWVDGGDIQGPQGPIGPIGPTGSTGSTGPVGPVGPQGPPGEIATLVGSFGVSKTPADLPTSGLIPANWDATGSPPSNYQMLDGQALLYTTTGDVWIYVTTVITPTGWVNGGSIEGPPGPTGPTGPQGIPGVSGIPDAPIDGQLYGRNTAAWVVVPAPGIADAPNTGAAYARKSLAWSTISHTDITDWTATLANYYLASNPNNYQTGTQVTTTLGPYALTSSVPIGSSIVPLVDSGTGSIGTNGTWAHADHVHPLGTVYDIDDVSWFGDGGDGVASITTTVTLTRDFYYQNLTISGSGKLIVNGYRVFVSGILDITAAAANAIIPYAISPGGAGGNGTSTASAAGVIGAFDPSNGSIAPTNTMVGQAGRAGTATGAAGTTPLSAIGASILGGRGGVGGAGGGTGAAGGPVSAAAFVPIRRLTVDFLYGASLTAGGQGGGGGQGGSGATSNFGGGGGASACGGGVVGVFARTINRGSSTPVGVINANGNNGGNGGNGFTGIASGGGAGGGSGGGFCYVVYRFLTGTTVVNALTANGGVGGTGGNGGSSGVGGAGGDGGDGGIVVQVNIAADTIVVVGPGTRGAGGAASGVTGGVGGTAGLSRQTL